MIENFVIALVIVGVMIAAEKLFRNWVAAGDSNDDPGDYL